MSSEGLNMVDETLETTEFDKDIDDSQNIDDLVEKTNTRPVPEAFVEIARKYKAQEPLADSELDLIADNAIDILRSMLGFFGAGDADIDEYDGGEGELILDVSNADLAILIGRHGKTLEAFQSLFTVLLNTRIGFHYPVIVDIEGYKNRRRQKLESMAHSSAQRALSRKTEVRMHPMKPYERRIVHLALKNTPGITTRSEGTEPNRYVVVMPRGN